MIDGVELALGNEPHQVRELERGHAVRFEHISKAGDEVVDVGHVGEHVVGRGEIGGAAFCGQPLPEFAAEECFPHFDALCSRHLRSAGGGLDAQTRNALGLHVLQQIAVVGRDLDHQRGRAELEAPGHRLDIALRMTQPALGVRAEVGIVAGEQVAVVRVVLRLHEPAGGAGEHAQRIPGLGRVELLGREVGIRRRRGAQVEERQGQVSVAVAALHHGRQIPLNSGVIGACRASRSDISAIGSGQAIASAGSLTCSAPSASGS